MSGTLDLNDNDKGGENWSDSGYIPKFEPVGFLYDFDMKCERDQSGITSVYLT